MVNFKLRRRKNDGSKKQESGIHSGVQAGSGAIGSGRPGMFGDRQSAGYSALLLFSAVTFTSP